MVITLLIRSRTHLSVSAHALGVASLPGGSVRTTDGVVGAVTLDSEATVLSTSRGEASSLTVLVDRVNDPVNARIVSDGNVLRINKDDLKVLVGGILVNPVRVQHSQVVAVAASTLLSHTSQVADEFQLVDTLVLGLTVNNTFVVRSLATTSANSNTVDDIALLGFVTQFVGLVGSSGASNTLNLLCLAVLPSSNTEQKAQNITLLLSPDLLKVFVSSHCVEFIALIKSYELILLKAGCGFLQ